METIEWRTVLGSLREKADDIPWRDRRSAVEQAAAVLRSGETSPEAEELLRLCAMDQKWQIRQAVAETLASIPEALFLDLARLLASDSNHFVQEAVEQAGRRRSAIQTAQNSLHRGLRSQLFDFEKRFGSDAARATIRFAERLNAEHLKAVAHNLKTLLTSLKSASRELAEKRGGDIQVQQIAADIEHLGRLAKDISRFSDVLEIDPTPESPRQFLEESHRLAREALSAQGKNTEGVTFSVQSSCNDLVPVSKTHIVVLFANLIQNAIEAHAISDTVFREGAVTVTIRRVEQMMEISVADTGKGLKAPDLSDLLEFIPGNTSKSWGTGYGLPIARKYAEIHGGTLAMTSKVGEGTTVTIELPLDRAE